MRNFYYLLCAAFLFSNCVKTDNYSAKKRVKEQTNWEVIWVENLKPDSMMVKRPTMRFDLKNLISKGNGGCNEFSSQILWDTKFMQFGQIKTSTAVCSESAQKLESALYNAMQRVMHAETADKNMNFTDGNGKTLFVLSPAD